MIACKNTIDAEAEPEFLSYGLHGIIGWPPRLTAVGQDEVHH